MIANDKECINVNDYNTSSTPIGDLASTIPPSPPESEWAGGHIIRSIRKNLGYTQAEFATILGLSESYYKSVDQGVCPVPTSVVQDLLRAEKGISPVCKELLLQTASRIVGSVVLKSDGRSQFRNADLVTRVAVVAPMLEFAEQAAIDAILLRALRRRNACKE